VIDGQTQLVGVIGYPVAHSLSPAMHNAAFDALGLNWRYLPLPVRENDVPAAIRGLAALGFRGANITVPHKVAAIPCMDSVSDTVRIVGAVNTICIDHATGRLEGTNTDMDGFMTDLAMNRIAVEPGHHVIILGAGGAARACAAGLMRAGARVIIINRTAERAQALTDSLRPNVHSGQIDAAGYDALPALAESATLIVNCTPLGMWPHVDGSPWPDGLPFPKGATLYDTIYRPMQTRLMREAEQVGVRVVGGLGMLVWQGAAAFELWTGIKPPADVMRAACESRLLVHE
jgi:shikimate dehydrogenase